MEEGETSLNKVQNGAACILRPQEIKLVVKNGSLRDLG